MSDLGEPAGMTRLVRIPDRNGELLEHLDEQPPERLADALDAIRGRQANLEEARKLLEAELRRRLRIVGRKFHVFGDWEVDGGVTRSRKWDADDLEGVLEDLVARDVIKAAEVVGIIKREPTVAGRAALDLRGRLDDSAQAAIDATWTWSERPKPLTVARSVQLVDAAARETLPAASSAPPQGARGDADHDATTAASTALVGSPEPPQPTPDLNPEELFA